VDLAHKINADNKTSDGITVEELEEKVVRNTVLYSSASICPMTAFFGGIVA
jgi:ubiquitin-activating enzyme E1